MQAPGQVGGGARQADADEAALAVAQLAGGGDRHHLLGGVAPSASLHASRRRSTRSPLVEHVLVASRPGSARGRGAIVVPGLVEAVVALRSSPAAYEGHAPPGTRQTAVTTQRGSTTAWGRGSSSSTISSTVTIARLAASTASFCTPMMPHSMHVAPPIGLLGVDDGDVGADRRHGRQPLAGERAVDERDRRRRARQVGAGVAAQHRERQPRRARRRRRSPCRVRVLVDLERPRPAVLDRVAQAVQRADARVAAPGEDHLRRAAHADHLVVDDVGRHADERQVAAALADDLVAGGERDQVREALERDRVAVVHVFGDRVAEGQLRDLGMSIGRDAISRIRWAHVCAHNEHEGAS